MGIKSLLGFGQARDKPVRNYSNGEYSFNFGRSTSGKSVNEMTAMQTTADYCSLCMCENFVRSNCITSDSCISIQRWWEGNGL